MDYIKDTKDLLNYLSDDTRGYSDGFKGHVAQQLLLEPMDNSITIEIIENQIRFLDNEVLTKFDRHNEDEEYMHKQTLLSIESLRLTVKLLK